MTHLGNTEPEGGDRVWLNTQHGAVAGASKLQSDIARRRARRLELKDPSVPNCGPEKSLRIDLGLELLYIRRLRGVELTQDDIAAWCGCTDGSIFLIEQRALKKLRNRLLFTSDPLLQEFRDF